MSDCDIYPENFFQGPNPSTVQLMELSCSLTNTST